MLQFRSVSIGLVVGCLLCFTNLYFGLQTGMIISTYTSLYLLNCFKGGSVCTFVVATTHIVSDFGQDVSAICAHWLPVSLALPATPNTPGECCLADNRCCNRLVMAIS
jgi:hypothetical protein